MSKRQGFEDDLRRVFDIDLGRHKAGSHSGGERGKNAGFDAAAETVGEHANDAVVALYTIKAIPAREIAVLADMVVINFQKVGLTSLYPL